MTESCRFAFGTAPAPRRYRYMFRPAVPLALIAFTIGACDNAAPSEGGASPTDVATSARPSASPPTPPPAPTGPYFATPAPGEELPTSQTTPGPIPLAFRHVWAIDPKDCTADPGLTRIAVAPGAIRFHEGRAVVVTAELSGDNTLILDVDQMSEGTTSRERHTLALESGGARLRYQRRGASYSYVQCD